MSRVLILGAGPAGVSAALYTTRAGLETTLLYRDGGSLMKAHAIENYYGFAEPVPASALMENGRKQAARLGARFVEAQAFGISWDGAFSVETDKGAYGAEALILATGTSRAAPRLKGLSELEGRGVSYCAVCDGFFYRGKDVAVLGAGDYAVHEAEELLPITASVTLLTNGEAAPAHLPKGLRAETRKLVALAGNDLLERAEFEDGGSLAVSGVFVALGTASGGDLARKLGVAMDGNRIIVDADMATNLPGLFAAGDCTGGKLQVAKAVYEGMAAGSAAIGFLRAQK